MVLVILVNMIQIFQADLIVIMVIVQVIVYVLMITNTEVGEYIQIVYYQHLHQLKNLEIILGKEDKKEQVVLQVKEILLGENLIQLNQKCL